MGRYHAKYESVEALRFDGSPGSLSALQAAFPGKIARHVDQPGVILALAGDAFGRERLRVVPVGTWLVRREPSDRLTVVADESFTPYHESLDL